MDAARQRNEVSLAAVAPPVLVYGATTCEDTAVTRSRLRALGVPFEELDVDVDPAAGERLAALNGGERRTPTIVLGDDGAAPAATATPEPSLERLGELLRTAGYDARSPELVQFHGELVTRPIPIRRLATPYGRDFSLEDVRTRRQVALFFGHDRGCLACFGYARQLGRAAARLADANASPIAAIPGEPEALAGWRHEAGPELTLLADAGGAWKRAVLEAVGHPEAPTALLVLDRFAAPRAGAFAPEAGGLADPSDAVEWLEFVALDCPECSTELPWPEPGRQRS